MATKQFVLLVNLTSNVNEEKLLDSIEEIIHGEDCGKVLFSGYKKPHETNKALTELRLNIEITPNLYPDKLLSKIEDIIHTQNYGSLLESRIAEIEPFDVAPSSPADNSCYELCPFCGNEVKLPNLLGKHDCPSCGGEIINCSMCKVGNDCAQCKIYFDSEVVLSDD